MSDFMKWLYAHYIRPQIDATPQGDYEFWFSLMDSELDSNGREAYEKKHGVHRHSRLFTGPAHRRGPVRGHSAINGSTWPRVRGPQTAVTSMVSLYSTFSTLASRYSMSSNPPLS